MAAALPPTPPIIPPIRTMADDLRGRDAGAPRAAPPPVSRPSPLPRRAAPGGRPTTAVAGLVPRPPAPFPRPGRPGAPPVQPVGLPARPGGKPRGRRIGLLLGVVAALVILGLGGGTALYFRARPAASVADALPAEALAFMSVQGDAVPDTMRATLAGAMGLRADLLAGATDVTYLLLPGRAPSEPVPGLFVRGLKAVDLSGTPALGVQSVRGGLLIVESAHLGRVSGLTGRAWSSDGVTRAALRGVPATPLLVGFKETALATLLQPYLPIPLTLRGPLVLALSPEGTGEVAGVVGKYGGEWTAASAEAPPSAEALPAGAVFAVERPATLLAAFLQGERALPSTLSEPLRVAQEESAALDQVLKLMAGPLVVGVLPTATPGTRDVAVAIPLVPGADPIAALRTLERAATKLGPFFIGTPVPDAAFGEGVYREVLIRYVNFGTPSRAFDYAVAGGRLLLATSRDSMFALVDTVLDGGLSLSAHPPFARLKGAARGSDWLFLRAHPALRDELPPAFRIFPQVLAALVLRPTGAGTLEGQAALGSTPVPGATPAPGTAAPTPIATPLPSLPSADDEI